MYVMNIYAWCECVQTLCCLLIHTLPYNVKNILKKILGQTDHHPYGPSHCRHLLAVAVAMAMSMVLSLKQKQKLVSGVVPLQQHLVFGSLGRPDGLEGGGTERRMHTHEHYSRATACCTCHWVEVQVQVEV